MCNGPAYKVAGNVELCLEQSEYEGHRMWNIQMTDLGSGENVDFSLTPKVARALSELIHEAENG